MNHIEDICSIRTSTAFWLLSMGAAISILAAPAAAVSYTIVNIADTSGPYSSFTNSPAVNNSGRVVFHGELDAGGLAISTRVAGGPLTTIATTTGGMFSSLGGVCSINDSGTVAFWAEYTPGHRGIFKGSGGSITVVADVDTPGSPYTDFDDVPSINSSGTVAFRANFNPFTSIGGSGISTGGGGTLYHTSGSFSDFGQVTINDSGVVTFVASLDGGAGTGVFSGSGGPYTTIALDTGPFLIFGGPPVINSAGTVAFRVQLDAGPVGMYITAPGGGGPVTPVADSSGPYGYFVPNGGDLNDSGTVAFEAGLDSGGHGIFTGPNPVADKVIKTGDPLFGDTAIELTFRRGLNDHGDIAFRYVLDNGQTGIALAIASPPPSPADLSGDGHVNGIDLGILLGQWTGAASYAPCPRFNAADLNHDCKINGLDLAMLLAAWAP